MLTNVQEQLGMLTNHRKNLSEHSARKCGRGTPILLSWVNLQRIRINFEACNGANADAHRRDVRTYRQR